MFSEDCTLHDGHNEEMTDDCSLCLFCLVQMCEYLWGKKKENRIVSDMEQSPLMFSVQTNRLAGEG